MKSFLLLTILLPLIWAYDFSSFYDSKRFYVPYQLELDTFSGYQAEFMERYLRNSSEYISFRPRTEQDYSFVSIYGSSQCRNYLLDDVCDSFQKAGYCKKYSDFMKVHCRKSCDFCHSNNYFYRFDETCRNNIPDESCQFMKSMDFCTTHKESMKQECAKTCNLCSVTNKDDKFFYENYFSKYFCEDYSKKSNCFEVFFRKFNKLSYFRSQCEDKSPKCTQMVNKLECRTVKEIGDLCPKSCHLC